MFKKIYYIMNYNCEPYNEILYIAKGKKEAVKFYNQAKEERKLKGDKYFNLTIEDKKGIVYASSVVNYNKFARVA